MRRSAFILLAALLWPASASAQTCETMVVKNKAGQVISDTEMCVGADGVWSPAPAYTAAPIEVIPEPIPIAAPAPVAPLIPQFEPVAPAQIVTPDPAVKPAPLAPVEAIEVAAPMPMPVARPLRADASTPSPLETPQPVYVDAPIPVAYEPALVQPIAAPQPAPAPPPAAKAVAQTSHQNAFAKLGLVCEAKQAMNCTAASPCGGRCAGKSGWCDGRTGNTYTSLQAIERANCRPK